MSLPKLGLLLFGLFFVLPLLLSALLHQRSGIGAAWPVADRGSAGLLPDPALHRDALVRVFAAPTVSWRGAVAVHAWIVLKPEGAARYVRYDFTAWGDPIRVDGFVPDGRWFGRVPQVAFAADGAAAARMIPPMQDAIARYRWRERGQYRAWPGPNSNTFVQAVLDAVPEAGAVLPPNAVGKDFPHDGRWLRWTGTGVRLSLGGVAGVALGWREGIEVNLLGAVAGLDWRRPALKLPGLGRVGLPPG